jgi:hypothetical protein
MTSVSNQHQFNRFESANDGTGITASANYDVGANGAHWTFEVTGSHGSVRGSGETDALGSWRTTGARLTDESGAVRDFIAGSDTAGHGSVTIGDVTHYVDGFTTFGHVMDRGTPSGLQQVLRGAIEALR